MIIYLFSFGTVLSDVSFYRLGEEVLVSRLGGGGGGGFYYTDFCLVRITRNPSHIASRISHVNQTELKKWLPDAIKKCMGSKIKSQFLPG